MRTLFAILVVLLLATAACDKKTNSTSNDPEQASAKQGESKAKEDEQILKVQFVEIELPPAPSRNKVSASGKKEAKELERIMPTLVPLMKRLEKDVQKITALSKQIVPLAEKAGEQATKLGLEDAQTRIVMQSMLSLAAYQVAEKQVLHAAEFRDVFVKTQQNVETDWDLYAQLDILKWFIRSFEKHYQQIDIAEAQLLDAIGQQKELARKIGAQ